MARSPRTPDAVIAAIKSRPAFLRAALSGDSLALGDVISLPDGTQTIQFAQPFVTPRGRRVLVSGLGPRVLHGFIGQYLAEIPDRTGGSAYLLDGRGALVAGPGVGAKQPLPGAEQGLPPAVARGSHGAFGNGRWFAARTLKNSRWRVVLTAREKTLFAAVTGEGRWVPWLLFAAFGLVASVALVLVVRVVRGAAQLHVSQERYALAVEGANDGIWDRDFVTGIAYFSPRWKGLLGYAPNEVGDDPDEWTARVHPDDLAGSPPRSMRTCAATSRPSRASIACATATARTAGF